MGLELVWSFSASLKNLRIWFDSRKTHQIKVVAIRLGGPSKWL